ncbi:MAG: HupE/UreJ family protein [Terrimicrobiaceae bacterium]
MNKTIKASPYALLLASLVGLPSIARAHHAEFMTGEPFLQGISMPIHGLDHMLVTIAVGLIAAQLGGKALWAIPGIFTVSVLLGGILNIMSVPVPLAEYGILASIAVFGGLLAWGSRLSILLTLGVTVLFAFCHGSALIANDSSVQNMTIFVAGCLFSALLLQGGGIALGLLLQRGLRLRVYRYAGLAMLVAASVISLFPSVNGFVINLIEKSGH